MSENTLENSYEFGCVVDSPDLDARRDVLRARNVSMSMSPSLSHGGVSSRKGSCDSSQARTPFGSRSSSIPDFVRSFVSGCSSREYDAGARTEHFRAMLSMLEKQQVIEMLCQSVMLEGFSDCESLKVVPEEIVRRWISRFATFRRLFVRNIPFDSTTEEVKDLLASRYGPIEEGTVVHDRHSNKSKGFAFITFRSIASACTAILDSQAGQIVLNNRQLILKFACDKGDEEAGTSGLMPYSGTWASCSPQKKLFVYNLSPLTTSESLAKVFGVYGPMEECIVVYSSNSGQSKRYAFVTYVSEDSAWRCLQEPSKTVDGQMTFAHLASEGPNIKPSPPSAIPKRQSGITTSVSGCSDAESSALVMSLISGLMNSGSWEA